MRELISCGHIRIADLALHKNRGMELTYITKGRMEWVVDGRVEVVQQGDVFFTLPWQLHGSPVLQQPENEAWHLLFRLPGEYRRPRSNFRFPPCLGLTAGQERQLSRTFSGAERHAWPASSRLKEIFPWMVRELGRSDSLSQVNGRNLLGSVLVELSREIMDAPPVHLESTESERRVKAFLDRLKSESAEPWSLEAMARACGVQRTRFSALVRKLTAFSPMTYLSRVRIDRARRMLRSEKWTVTEVALSCGFSSSQYFANVFRKYVGLSPTEYRRCFPELYDLKVDADAVPWRTIEEERERVRSFESG